MVAIRANRPSLLDPVLKAVSPDLKVLSARLESFLIGLPILPPPSYDAPDLQHVDNCLRLIEAILLASDSNDGPRDYLEPSRIAIVNGLISTSVVCQVVIGQEPDDSDQGIYF